MTISRRHIALAGALTLISQASIAEGYPDRPIRIVVPYAPGGSTDLIGRLIADPLGRVLGKAVIVDNKAGAGGMLGTAEIARAQPDGYTLGIGTVSTMVIFPAVHPKPGYTIEQIKPLSNVATMPNVLAVNPNFPARDLKELITVLKANPGRYAYASSGKGSINHLLGESFQAGAGVKITHVPYRGAGPAMQDVMAGQLDILFDQLPSSKTYIDAGKLKLLGVVAPKRLAEYPQVMTMEDAGIKGFTDQAWYGLIGPAKLPEEVLGKLNTALKQVMAMPEVRARLTKLGAAPLGNTPEEYSQQIQREITRMKVLVRDRDVSLEE